MTKQENHRDYTNDRADKPETMPITDQESYGDHAK